MATSNLESRINSMLARLAELKAQFGESSKSAQDLERAIQTLQGAFNKLGEAVANNASQKIIQTYQQQLDKMINAIETRTGERIQAAGRRMSTTTVSDIYTGKIVPPTQRTTTEQPKNRVASPAEIEELNNSVYEKKIRAISEALQSIGLGDPAIKKIVDDLKQLNAQIDKIDTKKIRDNPFNEKYSKLERIPFVNESGTKSSIPPQYFNKQTGELVSREEYYAARRYTGNSGIGNNQGILASSMTADQLKGMAPGINVLKPEALDAAVKKIQEMGQKVHVVSAEVQTLIGDFEQLRVVTAGGKVLEFKYNKSTGLQAFSEDIRKAEREVQELKRQQEQIATFKQAGNYIPGGNPAYTNAMKLAQKIDPRFDESTLQNISTEGSTGISRLAFQLKEADGIYKNLTVTVDKFGQVLTDTQKRFRTFGGEIVRNFTEVLKWSIAVGAVYYPIQKFNELLSQMTQTQTKLAESTVALADAQKSTAEIFQRSFEIAQTMGEDVGDTISAFTTAYRATGGSTDATKRFAEASKLLADALTLSKLSAFEEGEAIDTLAAALQQSGRSMSQGTELLDKSVRTTKIANVSLDTLATGFATLSDAAESAAIKEDELNGIIAVIAESTNMSGQEVANAARAIVSGMQSDQAAQALQRIGIAVTDVSGKARDFLDIMKDIYSLRKEGILSDTEFSKLTLALGGGTRRQAVYTTFIENLNRVFEVANESANASGDAAKALALQLTTVETASKRLGNAFSQLAQSMGNQGGLLDLFTSILTIAEKLVSAFATLSASIGKVGPVLLGVIGASAFLNSKTPLYRQNVTNQIGGGLFSMGNWLYNNSSTAQRVGGRMNEGVGPTWRLQTPEQAGQGFTNFWDGMRGNKWGRIGTASMIGILPALANLTRQVEGTPEEQAIAKSENLKRAGADIGGAVVGAIITGGNPIGAAVGSAIAESFVNETILYKPQWENFFKDVAPKPSDTKPKEQTPMELFIQRRDEARNLASDQAFKDIGLGNKQIGVIATSITKGILDFGRTILGDRVPDLTREELALMGSSRKTQKQFQVATQYSEYTSGMESGEFQKQVKQTLETRYNGKTIGDIINETANKYEKDLLDQLNKNQLTPANFKRITQQQLSPLNMENYYTAFGQKLGNQMGLNPEQTINVLGSVTTKSSKEEIDYITQLGSQVSTAQNMIKLYETQLQGLDKGSKQYEETLKNLTEAYQFYNESVDNAAKYTANLFSTQNAQIKLAPQIDLTGFKQEDILAIIKEAKDEMNKDLQGQVDLKLFSKDQVEDYAKNLQPIVGKTDTLYKLLEGIDSKYIEDKIKKFEKAGKRIAESQNVGFQQYELTMNQLSGYLNGPNSAYETLKNKLSSAGATINETPEVVISKDGAMQQMTKDWKIVQYLLSEILKVNQKQLDGMYNLPEGSSFWVPYNAAKMSAETMANKLLQGIKNNNASLQATAGAKAGTQQIPATANAKVGIQQIPATAGVKAGTQLTGIAGAKAGVDTPTMSAISSDIKNVVDAVSKNDPKEVVVAIGRLGSDVSLSIQSVVNEVSKIPESIKLFLSQPVKGVALNPYDNPNFSKQYTNNASDLAKSAEAKIGIDTSNTNTFNPKDFSNTFSQAIQDAFAGELQNLTNSLKDLITKPMDSGLQNVPDFNFQDLFKSLSSNLSTKLSVSIDSKTTVMLDSRAIGEAVNRYLADQLVKFDSTGGSSVKLQVI